MKENKRKRGRKVKTRFNIKIFLLGLVFMIAFVGITSPILILYGPYDTLRKTAISTVLATRHKYLITDMFSQQEIDKFLGVTESSGKEEVQDIKKVSIKNRGSNDVSCQEIHTDRFDGFLVKISNPTKVKVAMTKYLYKKGQKTSEMAEDHNAIAAINGGAFVDKSSNGTAFAGTGAEPGGFVVSGGKVIYPKQEDLKTVYNVVAFTEDGHLIVGDKSLGELKSMKVKEAMCFRRPNLIINGKPQITNRMEEGLNPRTAVAQTGDGTVLFLVIDGRKATKLGASLYDVQKIFLEYGAVNAGCLDGGYSSTLYYEGEVINSPNAWDGERSVATAFYVEE
ncbi:Exopolysaccharide biosynthesis protein [Clostridium cavendishii DSM 21758]|uniref:Exopolysaccharide biosynthesis protein n=1 Tax=Clostridium cavendishii DSM 21758 TaxID=1121302 RepID=A0A1M6PKK5_9CLOT|nr:phosphodiester glycosidase family protein [Clostridium cavendishii]SHK08451.1 Exopolysaccharide biosynthesis protein [Clostridium cavendishii DSM 21758]